MPKIMILLRKFAALVVGVPIIVLGVVLIPLPGPGILIMFLGLFILSLEFEWASKHADKLKAQLKRTYNEAKNKANKP